MGRPLRNLPGELGLVLLAEIECFGHGGFLDRHQPVQLDLPRLPHHSRLRYPTQHLKTRKRPVIPQDQSPVRVTSIV